ncbi:MAG: hypothetical protein A2202_03055 [Bdellovibrionales bacterium RIFOXYA1_FULL_36_14]|nr:MAG: hypothetical protein A2202_03055 [Bdellovibrionales bacterium RIFOXYA1_FULL_36_14]
MVIYERTKTFLLFGFATLTLGASLYLMLANWGESSPLDYNNNDEKSKGAKSFLSSVDYFFMENEKPKMFLNGEILVMYENGNTGKVITPNGSAYMENGTEIKYAANEGMWDRDKDLIELSGDVKMKTVDSHIESNKAKYNLKKEVLSYNGNVKTKTVSKENGDTIFVNADNATSWLNLRQSRFQDQVSGHIVRKRVYEDRVYFSSDLLNFDLFTHIIDLLGKVTIKHQQITAEALKGEIHLKEYNKKLKYYALSDDVKLQQILTLSHNKKITRRAFAERLEGIMSEEKIILTGNPKVFQERDVVKGNRIILRGDTETVEVDDAITNVIVK